MRQLESNTEFRQVVDAERGFVLNVRAKSMGMVHFTSCGHLKAFTNNPAADFTRKAKYWSESKDELVGKAQELGVVLAPCPDCGA